MERKHLALLWGTHVVTPDGRAGRVREAILAPHSSRISHVVLRRSLRRIATLPLTQATQEADGTLVLPHDQKRSGDAQPRRGSIHFSPRNVVHCGDASSLPLRGFLLDSGDNAVTSLLAGPRGNPKVIAIDKVKNLGSGSPSATDIDMQELPTYRPAYEAQLRAEGALRDADPTGGATYQAVQVEVRDGTAYLTGNVRLPVQKADAERAVRRAPGVIDVQSDIATDQDIQIAIAEAIARAGLTRSGTVLVKSSLGRVTLTGSLASDEQIQQAASLAGAIGGVHEVATGIGIAEPPPAVEPPPELEEEDEGQENEEEPAKEEEA